MLQIPMWELSFSKKQMVLGNPFPFSPKTFCNRTRYSTLDRELLATFLSVKHFRFFLEGRPFTLFTDHKPLLAAIGKQSTPFSSRQKRHLSFLSEFNASFQHLPSHKNEVADALSRPTISQISMASIPSSFALVLHRYGHCPTNRSLHPCPPKIPIPQHHLHPHRQIPFPSRCVSTNIFRALVPSSCQKAIFEHMLSLGHPGIKTTRRLISSRFVWSHMATDINLLNIY
jgi:hypothetical protein